MKSLLILASYTIDKIGGEVRIGGPAFFCSIGADVLSWEAYIIGSLGADFSCKVPYKGYFIKTPTTIKFEHVYEAAGQRKSRILTREITVINLPRIKDMIKKHYSSSPIVLSPVMHEFDLSVVEYLVDKYELVAIDVQGFLRKSDKNGHIILAKPNPELLSIINNATIVKASLEEYCVLKRKLGRIFIVTLSDRGALLFDREEKKKVYAPAYVVKGDPTGAGDIFISAFTIKYQETMDLAESLSYANALASLLIDGSLFPKSYLSCGRTLEIPKLLRKNIKKITTLLIERKENILRRVIKSGELIRNDCNK